MDRSQDWIYEARGDLEHARADEERGYYNWACFSAQQAAEKTEGEYQRLGPTIGRMIEGGIVVFSIETA